MIVLFFNQLDLPLAGNRFVFDFGERYRFVDDFQSQNFPRLGALLQLLGKRCASLFTDIFQNFTLDFDGFGFFGFTLVDFGADFHHLFGNTDLARGGHSEKKRKYKRFLVHFNNACSNRHYWRYLIWLSEKFVYKPQNCNNYRQLSSFLSLD
jgi:hypothetical protein